MKKAAIALLLILAALALAACGGGGSSTSEETTGGGATETEGGAAKEEGAGTGPAATIKIEASPSGLAYKEQKVTAEAGEDTIDFTNPASIVHNVTIEDSAGKTIGETETLAEGSTSTTVDLEPGTYTYFCSVPGHREAGMEGTLVVE